MMRPFIAAAAAVVVLCLVGLVSLPAKSEASFSASPDEALGSGSSAAVSLSPPEALAGTETGLLLQETETAAEQFLSPVSREAEEKQTALVDATETETRLLQQPAFDGPVAGQANPRRLMVAAGAGIGLVLLAGGAVAHEHADSIKTSLKSIYYSIKNKPLSWAYFSWKLPRVDEDQFPEFKVVAEGLEKPVVKPMRPEAAAVPNGAEEPKKRRTFVSVVEKPSRELADFLNLEERERETGFVLKGRSFREEFSREQTVWEVYVMQRHVPKHLFFVPLLSAYRSAHSGNVYLILPRACCDLSQYAHTAPRAINVQVAAAEMVMSLHLLHQRGFLHRDIKPHNYLVSQEGHVLLGDMEMLWPIDLPCPQEEATHTRGFAAPELQRIGSYAPFSIKTDVFALGMAFARVMMRVQRYQAVPRQNILVKLILLMVNKEVKDRIDLDAVMRHEYFDGIDWQQIERGEAPPPCPLAKQVMNYISRSRQQQDGQQQQQQQQQQGQQTDEVNPASSLQQQLADEKQHTPQDHQQQEQQQQQREQQQQQQQEQQQQQQEQQQQQQEQQQQVLQEQEQQEQVLQEQQQQEQQQQEQQQQEQQQQQQEQEQQEGGEREVLLPPGIEEAEKLETAEEQRNSTGETRTQD